MSYTGNQHVVYDFSEFLPCFLFKGQYHFLLHFDLETYFIPQQVKFQLGQIVDLLEKMPTVWTMWVVQWDPPKLDYFSSCFRFVRISAMSGY